MQILFIDDDQEDYELFCEAIREIKGETHCVHEQDGASAIRYLQGSTQLPDYIFLDLHMHAMAGVECLKKIKADRKLKDVPVVIYTSDTYGIVANANVKRYQQLGAAGFIQKGSTFQEIVRSLRDFFSIDTGSL